LQDVVGESEHAQHGLDLEATAHHELAEVPLPESGVDAFAHAAPLVDGLAVRALHALAPGGHTGTIIAARRLGIGVVLAADRRAIHVHADAGSPFGVVILVEAAIDEVTSGPAAIAPFDLREHWWH
jgi:hypothetical protein